MQRYFEFPRLRKVSTFRMGTLIGMGLIVGCFTFGPTKGVSQTAREDVPKEYAEMENPTPPLSEKDLS